MPIEHKKPHAPRSVFTNPIHFIAFGFGSGAVPFAPGTFGTLMAIPLYYVMQDLSLITYLLITLAIIIFGTWVSHVTEKDLGVPDHSGIVIDEIAGYLVTMIAAPKGWLWIVLGFILFRIFDIWKPFPIRYLDQHVPGGAGIMLDDIIAAVYAWVGMWGIHVLFFFY
jgi:phosphatidylglycerophosphatase A